MNTLELKKNIYYYDEYSFVKLQQLLTSKYT